MGEAWERLGRLVRERRIQLGHTSVGAFGDAAGLSRRVVSDIEGGKRENYDQVTIRQVEYALGWDDGSIASVLAGGDPATVDDPEVRGLPGPARLADAVRRRRAELGLERADLIERSGLSGRTIDAIESGRVILKPGPRAQLAEALEWADADVAGILRSSRIVGIGAIGSALADHLTESQSPALRGSTAQETRVGPMRDVDVAAPFDEPDPLEAKLERLQLLDHGLNPTDRRRLRDNVQLLVEWVMARQGIDEPTPEQVADLEALQRAANAHNRAMRERGQGVNGEPVDEARRRS